MPSTLASLTKQRAKTQDRRTRVGTSNLRHNAITNTSNLQSLLTLADPPWKLCPKSSCVTLRITIMQESSRTLRQEANRSVTRTDARIIVRTDWTKLYRVGWNDNSLRMVWRLVSHKDILVQMIIFGRLDGMQVNHVSLFKKIFSNIWHF